ncbi:MAG: hypothetical protein ACE5OT_05215 [Candidatus Hadarchaeaceae archaeon]
MKNKKCFYGTLIITAVVLIVWMGLSVYYDRQEGVAPEKPPSQEGDWLKKNNTYAFLGGEKVPSPEVIDNLSIDVFIWGPSIITNDIRQLGRRAVPVLWGLSARLMGDVEWIKEAYGIDLLENYPGIDVAGNTIPVEDPLGLGEGMLTICRTLFHQKLGEVLRRIIDDLFVPTNPNGVIIDEIAAYAPNPNVNMNNNTMVAFREFLKQRYSNEELENRFGIENVDNFNYREYLAGQGIQSVYLDPNPELKDEFRRFLLLDVKEEIGNLIDYMKGKMDNLYLTGNVYGLWPEQHAFIPHLDFLTFENPFFTQRLGGWVGKEEFKFFGLYELAKALGEGKPVIAFPDVFDFGYLLNKDDYSYYKLFLSEAFAMGESFLLAFDALAEGGRRYTIKPETLSPYSNFIKKHNPLLVKRKEWTDIGVLYDWYRNFRDLDSHYHFMKTTTALQEGQWLFGVVYVGDGDVVDIATSMETKDYEAIIVPYGPFPLSQRSQDILNQYQAMGGSVIYLEEGDNKDDILSKMDFLGLDKRVDIENKKNISISVYDVNENKQVIVLVNYHYDWEQKDFIKEQNIKVTTKVHKNVKEVYFFTPEQDFPQRIDFSMDDGYLKFTLPELYILNMVMIEY